MEYTKYEKARLIGARALQLSMGAPMLLKLSEEDLDKINWNVIEIAKMEFQKGILPISIKRD
jgi:DNA-directed RNA polymerase subunit K